MANETQSAIQIPRDTSKTEIRGNKDNSDPWNKDWGEARASDDYIATEPERRAAENEERKRKGQVSIEEGEQAFEQDPDSFSSKMWGYTGPNLESQTPGWAGTGQYYTIAGYKVDPNASKTKGFDQTQTELRRGAVEAQRRQGIQTNTAPQDQFRRGQLSLANMLMAQSRGEGPSVAQYQAQQASDRNLANALAMQASQRGAGQQGGLRQAADQRASIGQQLAADSATLRLQEQQQAQARLSEVLNGGRGQDLGLSGQLAQTDLASRSQNDDLYKFNTAQSMSSLQADQQARAEQEKLRTQQDLEREKIRAAEYENNREGEREVFKSVLDVMGNVAKAGSDKKLKTDIKSGEREITAFLDALNAHSYRYKDSKHGEGRRISPMAQEFQKSALGKVLVEKSKDGLMVNYGKGIGTIAAALASIHKRLKEVEAHS